MLSFSVFFSVCVCVCVLEQRGIQTGILANEWLGIEIMSRIYISKRTTNNKQQQQ